MKPLLSYHTVPIFSVVAILSMCLLFSPVCASLATSSDMSDPGTYGIDPALDSVGPQVLSEISFKVPFSNSSGSAGGGMVKLSTSPGDGKGSLGPDTVSTTPLEKPREKAAPASPSIEAYLGFNDRQVLHKSGIPQILRVTVSNPTPKAFECRVAVTQDAPGESPVTIDLNIMPMTANSFRIPVVIARASKAVNLALNEKSSGRYLDSWKINIETLAPEDRFILFIGGRNLVDSQLFNMARSPRNKGASRVNQKYATHCERSDFPENWEYLLTADTVLVSEEVPLDGKMVDCLTKYAAAGGRVVFICGTRPNRFEGFFGTFAFPGANPRRASMEVPSGYVLAARTGPNDQNSGAMAKSARSSSQKLSAFALEAEGFEGDARTYAPWGIPIVHSRHSGLGEVNYLMTDHETAARIQTCPGESLVESLTDPQGFLTYAQALKPGLSVDRSFPDRLDALMPLFDDTLQNRIPSRIFVLLFISAYLAVGFGLNYLILKGSGRLEFGWIFLMITAVLFAVGLHGSGVTPAGHEMSMFGVTFQYLGNGQAFEPSESFWALHSSAGCSSDLYFGQSSQVKFRDENSSSAAGVYEVPNLEWTSSGLAARNIRIRQKSYRFVSSRNFGRKPAGFINIDCSNVEVSADAPGPLLFQIRSTEGAIAFGPGAKPGSGKNPLPGGDSTLGTNVDTESTDAVLARSLESIFSKMPSSWWVGVFREYEAGIGVSGAKAIAGGYRIFVRQLPQIVGGWTGWIETSYDQGAEFDGRRLFAGKERVYLALQPDAPFKGWPIGSRDTAGPFLLPGLGAHEAIRQGGARPSLGKVINTASTVSVFDFTTGFYRPFEKFDSRCVHPVTNILRLKTSVTSNSPAVAVVFF